MEEEIKFEFVSRLGDQTPVEGKTSEYKLPQKGSKKAAGYDFFNIEEVELQPHQIKYVKTGIKAKFPDNVVLLLFNRSSNPKKKNLIVINGVGVVDADYYNNEDNEGEIAFAFYNISAVPVIIDKGEKLGQGMFVEYKDVTNYTDESIEERKGGFGSTGV